MAWALWLLAFGLLSAVRATYRIDAVSSMLWSGVLPEMAASRDKAAVEITPQSVVDLNGGITSLPIVLGSRVFYFDISLTMLKQLQSRNLSLEEQQGTIRGLQSAMQSKAWHTARALEDLLPVRTSIRYSHIEIILEHQGDNGQALLRQLYLDVRATDEVGGLAAAACEELGFPAHTGCLDYVHAEIERTITFPLNYTDAVLAFSPKAHYDTAVLPACLLLREGFDSNLVKGRRKISVSRQAESETVARSERDEEIVMNGNVEIPLESRDFSSDVQSFC
jgi:hypothetical protein